MKSTLLQGASAIVAVSLSASGMAQNSTPSAANAEQVQTGESIGSIQDIVVTANKRTQRLSDVGITVAVLSGDALKNSNTTSLQDIARAVPGLNYSTSALGTPVFTLRGIGFYETSLAAYPTTSVYLDEVPLPFPVMTKQTAFDLQRIEVLKGPQGTLFGNNATGGALNYIAAKPQSSFAAGFDVGYGRFNAISAEGFVTGPLSRNTAARLAVKVGHSDDWQKSYTRKDSTGKAEYYAARLLIDSQIGNRLRLQLNLNGWIDKTDPQSPQLLQVTPQQAVFYPSLGNAPVAPHNNRATDWSPLVPPRADDWLVQAALRADWELSENVTVTSISSYTRYDQKESIEGDGTAVSTIDFPRFNGKITSLSQELRVSNGASGSTRWIVGANYSRDKVFDFEHQKFTESSANTALGLDQATYQTHQKMHNYAVFANIEQDLGSGLTAKGGMRYTWSTRDADFCSNDPFPEGGTRDFLQFLSGLLTGSSIPPIAPDECYVLGPDFRPSITPSIRSLKQNNLSWRVGVDWKAAPDTLLYANLSKGYKAGSFPTLSASTTSQYRAVVQESVLAYEAGVKTQLFDRTLSLNAAAFYYDYTNKQLRSKMIDPVFGILDVLANVPKSSVKGAEIEATIYPTRNFSVTGGAVYTDAKIKKFVGANGQGVIQDFAGTRVPFSPKWRLDARASYEAPLSDNMTGLLGIDYTYQTSSSAVIGATGLFRIDAYGLLNANIGVKASDDSWRVTIWGKNLTNKYYWTNAAQPNDTIVRWAGRPVTYGLTVGMRFQ